MTRVRKPTKSLPVKTYNPSSPAVNGNAGRAAKVEASFRSSYAHVQYHYVQFLTEHLVDCSKTFHGDFDQVIILAVLGQNHIRAVIAMREGRGGSSPPMWINASRLADVTGLPRETVRRKLLTLAERGWVQQNAKKGWELVGPAEHTKAKRDLTGLDRRAIQRLAKLYAALEPVA
jgi:hypothetical protein